ncbi:DUF2235 domain-containing protein [Acinetobacter gerneri]|uniref:DUF2235 domain-containing protein n=1 Tax=Acinetobacter gerneri TaxID=202952 RepID=A0AAW8JF29_9GAMM|nr:DUF2235 domain-containing protein [Acinetobacter gerneri]MDQ9009802.1 DUF2235 domain-containing protein [Acinetobacter gerneri]MDQ9013956.1 DUF2235 domain-containing protein [Acinetobacter gerneri]MDQ9023589.1 DUF2235 domain-containing protein [Acinetobacter gerneri]MDQ9052465.1 DUF2235 domain-containing protein [Acinetobacter gerneri]MDQ9060026.1 DUF2235 domain-containing protein [Acinetobacter gerneri]
MATLPAQDQSKSKQKPLTTVSTNKPPNSSVPLTVKPIVVNVFFDGTKNNLYNTDARKYFKALIEKERDKYESYENDYSNIAHLFTQRYGENGENIWVYVEGIGTKQYTTDDTQGFAFGSGDYGIIMRTHKDAISLIRKRFEKFNGNSIRPSSLIFNVFGFSRGAAAARHFIHYCKISDPFFPFWKINRFSTQFRFVGIFDTVSSFSYHYSAKPNFNDVDELNLDFKALSTDDKKNIKVFHITAADEYRGYFSLTDITAALKGKYGYEVSMDGAHSDIGGSYPSGLKDSYYFKTPEMKAWFFEKGFYFEKDDEIKSVITNTKDSFGPEFQAQRKNSIPNDYHKISLRTMRLMTQKYAKIQFGQEILNHESKGLVGTLIELMNLHPSFVLKNHVWGKRDDLCVKDKAKVQKLRHEYLHWSARRTRTEEAKTISDDTGYEVNLKNGLPYRVVYHG